MNKVVVTVSHPHFWLLNSILFPSEQSYYSRLPLLVHGYLYSNPMPHRYRKFPRAGGRDTAISRPATAYLACCDPGVGTAQSSVYISCVICVFFHE